MSLIETTQRDLFFEQAIEKSLKTVSLYDLNNNFAEIKQSELGISGVYGNPLAKPVPALRGTPIDVNKVKSYIDNLFLDTQVLDSSMTTLYNTGVNSLSDMVILVENLKNMLNSLSKRIQANNKSSVGSSTWSFTDTFHNTFNVNQSFSNVQVDTALGQVSLIQTISPYQPTSIVQSTGTGLNLTSTSSNMVDNNQATAWKIVCQNNNDSATVVLSFDSIDLNYISLDPIGFGLGVSIVVKGDTSLTINEVMYSKNQFLVNIANVTSVEITIHSTSSILPNVVGLKSVQFFSTINKGSGSYYSTEFLVPPFSQIRIDSTQNQYNSTSINWFWGNDGSTWNKINPGTWNYIASPLYNTILIPKTSVQANGYYSLTTGATGQYTFTGSLVVGTNQFEVGAQLTGGIADGSIVYVPTDVQFTDTRKAWADPSSTSISILSTGHCPIQVDPTTAATNFYTGGSLVGKLNYPVLGSCLTWVPITPTSISCQKNFHYRFKTSVFAEAAVSVPQAAYWFVQGFKQLGTPSYKQTQFSLGSFSLYINGILVSGESYPDTLYTDNSSDTNASLSSGTNYSMNLNAGWNEIEVHLYCPNIPNYLVPPSHIRDFLQLVIYPNVFDSSVQSQLGITSVVGSGTFNPVSYFDLIWKVPKDFTYWSWSEIDLTTVLFNSKTTPLIDYFYGGNSLITYPDLRLKYQAQVQGSNLPLYIRADLASTNTQINPTISQMSVYTQ